MKTISRYAGESGIVKNNLKDQDRHGDRMRRTTQSAFKVRRFNVSRLLYG